MIRSLYREHPPFIRYKLRDYIRIVSDGRRPCGCGSQTRKMDHFLGRSDDMVKIRGTNVFPMACVRAVTSDDRTTGEWLCVVERRAAGLNVRDEMTVQVEVYRRAWATGTPWSTSWRSRSSPTWVSGSSSSCRKHLHSRLFVLLPLIVARKCADSFKNL